MTKAMIKRCTGTLVALCIYSISGLNAQNITVKNDCFRTDFSEDGVSVFQARGALVGGLKIFLGSEKPSSMVVAMVRILAPAEMANAI